MAIIITPLTDSFIKRLKFSKEKSNTHFDGGGLVLEVRKTGVKKWSVHYRKSDGKRSTITLGDYPQITLAKARERRDEIRAQVAEGLNPVVERQIKLDNQKRNAGNTFENIANEFLEFKRNSWMVITPFLIAVGSRII